MPGETTRRTQWILGGGIAVIVALAIGFVALVVSDDKATGPLRPLGGRDPGVGYVHDLGVDPKDGTLYAATRTGVFRIPTAGEATRVANRHQETMGFTVAGPGVFLGSGHPDTREDLPDQLGLVQSKDSGQTWQTLSLSGRASFRALEYKHNTVYGYEAGTARVMVSKDKQSWDHRAVVPMADFSVSPVNADILVATTEQGLARSTDGGRTFTVLEGAPSMLRVSWAAADALFGVTEDGTLQRSIDGGETWERAGRVDGEPQALHAVDARTLYVATESGIYASTDGGKTFAARLRTN